MAGRPTDYNEEIVEKAREYIFLFTDESTIPKDEVIPSIEGLALYIDMNRSTLYEWDGSEGKEEFSDIMDTLRSLQGKTLLTGSLTNKLNANISKAILSRHGYHEKTEVDQKTEHSLDEKSTDILSKVYGS